METIYKPKVTTLISRLIGSLLGAAFVYILRWEPILTDQTSPWIALAIPSFTLLFGLLAMRRQIIVGKDNLTVVQGKSRQSYALTEHAFGAVTHNDGRQYLLIFLPDGTKREIDCEYLSDADFQSLTDELGITGEKQKAIKLKTKEKPLIEE